MIERGVMNLFGRSMYYRLFASFGLAGIVYALSTNNLIAFVVILLLPLLLIAMITVLEKPILLLYITFCFNYLIIGVAKYVDLSGISLLMDILLLSQLLMIFIHGVLLRNVEWKSAINTLTGVTFVWMIYCILEVVNPTALFEAWYLARNLIFNGFIISIIGVLAIKNFKEVKTIVIIYSILSLLAVAKALMQKFIGFDAGEQKWLDEGGAVTHIIISGIRYFSFFTDAGNFGSNMGCAATLFGILAFYVEQRKLKIYYLIVSGLTLYAMFMSGTRGAMIVPLGGLAIYTLLSKNFKAFISGVVMLIIIYVFFAFTFIGESNDMIRRMRTSFRPSEDPSFNVREKNQAILAEYLKDKPFGEGLGLSGVESKRLSIRLTTLTPNDSWYVKIWVETGIVGLLIYIAGLIAVIIRCSYIIIFKIKDRELRGIFIAMLSGVFGLLLSAYGNAFFGQYPTMIMSFIFLAIIINGETIEKTIAQKALV